MHKIISMFGGGMSEVMLQRVRYRGVCVFGVIRIFCLLTTELKKLLCYDFHCLSYRILQFLCLCENIFKYDLILIQFFNLNLACPYS
jgi:hypothetical protein